MESLSHPQELEESNRALEEVFLDWKMEADTRDRGDKFDNEYQIKMRELIEAGMEKGWNLEIVIKKLLGDKPWESNVKDLEELKTKTDLGDKVVVRVESYGHDTGDMRSPWINISEETPGIHLRESLHRSGLELQADVIESLRFVSPSKSNRV